MLTQLQQKIVDAPFDKIVVNAAAASGKTTVLIEKIRQLIKANINPKEIVAITFTNMAANEIKSRLGEDYKPGLFIGTIHSLANQMLLRAGIQTGAVIDDEKFDQLFPMIKKNPRCIWDVEWLLLDEAQDSNGDQFEFIFEMIKPRCFFVVGDTRQSIYRWNGSDPSLLRELSTLPDVRTFSLNENHRNGRNILAYASGYLTRIHQYDDSIALRPGGQVVQSKYDMSKVIKYIGLNPDYKNWAILTRTNGQSYDVMDALKFAGVPFDTFKQGALTRDELMEKMAANTVKVLTIHSAKGLEWDNVVVIGLESYSEEEFNVAYVGCTRAKDFLMVMPKPTKRKRY